MKSPLPGLPANFAYALLAVFGLMAFVIFDQLHWWQTKEDYMHGYLVPLFVAFVLYDRWERIRAAVAQPVPGPSSPGLLKVMKLLASVGLVSGGLLFLFGALIRANQGAAPPASVALAVGLGVMTLAIVFLFLPEAPAGAEAPAGRGGLFTNPRTRATMFFLFPAFIWILSAPLLGVVERELNVFLLQKVTVVVQYSFNFVGVPVIQEGNTLFLGFDPAGNENRVGVAEACSGIRSLTGCLFAGSFLAAVFLRTFGQRVLLVALAALLAVFTNLLRSIFLTGWSYAYGAHSIEGAVHDYTGFAVLGVTTVLLLCLLPLFNLKMKVNGSAGPAGGAARVA